MVNNKSTGSFFTPSTLANSIAKYLFERRGQPKAVTRILEPSVGHGVFLNAIDAVLTANPDTQVTVTAIDIDEEFITECKTQEYQNFDAVYLKQDFLDFNCDPGDFDFVIGNPPYVSYKLLSKESVEKYRGYYSQNSIENANFLNLYTVFLHKSANALSDEGVLCFVLPKEFLYVNHAAWLRKFLVGFFPRIEIFILDDFHFLKAEQDVIVLVCYKQHLEAGLYVDDSGDVIGKHPEFSKINSGDEGGKWSHYQVTESENVLINKYISPLNNVSNYCSAVAGIVTAANSFFILKKADIIQHGFEEFTRPIIQHSAFLLRDINVTEDVFNRIVDNGHPCFLLTGYDLNAPPQAVLSYLEQGEMQGLQNRYKMTLRKPWHNIPSIWESEGIFFKRMDQMPKFVKNSAGLLVTDSGYRVTCHEGFEINSLIYSFYNSLTLIHAELTGRSYGGGVLELTPNEFKRLKIPYTRVGSDEFNAFTQKFRDLPFDLAIESHDREILPKIGLTPPEIENIQLIRNRMYRRRTKKRQKNEHYTYS